MNNLHVLIYDGSFEGLLCCLFRIYEQRIMVYDVVKEKNANIDLFYESIKIETDKAKADRVWAVILKKGSNKSINRILNAFLSDKRGEEMTILKYMQYIVSSEINIENDFQNPILIRMLYLTKAFQTKFLAPESNKKLKLVNRMQLKKQRREI
jgi:probable DNA metabolism protein